MGLHRRRFQRRADGRNALRALRDHEDRLPVLQRLRQPHVLVEERPKAHPHDVADLQLRAGGQVGQPLARLVGAVLHQDLDDAGRKVRTLGVGLVRGGRDRQRRERLVALRVREAQAHLLPRLLVAIDPARSLLHMLALAAVQVGHLVLHAEHQRAHHAVRALRPVLDHCGGRPCQRGRLAGSAGGRPLAGARRAGGHAAHWRP
mmetsp:Transcript_34671/g.88705  ORF Transcript_34671/g.88705 Transcript_34671/m.88705 type:complete len:204 (+) Transcript_34671:291-902(+)